ncbi:poly adp-ribose glycohydrolase, putative [Ichthyophthirius multifiliis]|uniref:poly(ADP-ribose) glycohydrolase n=1 Tax=Ichthyophthirius multifiliis TaxID=5932 RepID=G0QVI5_ICHMU|nr:poly adp-ribose glycohydrolase, putative [Ichthyophthirius multifiliis]EGR30771.1 poly adp-ribose glycohydrolase, putative [Ichthyophthirius multifiliis]|eukprot:XP_004032358.1 poly adp-ribose glycohydrolase, putative [Ichthyophthirius multifiliis]
MNLKQFLDQNQGQKDFYLQDLIPFIAQLALKIEQIPQIIFLQAYKKNQITLNRLQVAVIIANMFFCTLIPQEKKYNLPNTYNLNTLYKSTYQNNRKIQKIKCIFNYFSLIKKTQEKTLENEKIEYIRLYNQNYINARSLIENQQKLKKIYIQKNNKNIEDIKNSIQIDFANKYIGGGVLDTGLVQEEIRFVISPELLILRLFSFKIEDQEAILVSGIDTYSIYRGYSNTFECLGENKNRKNDILVAIDALNFSQSYDSGIQYRINVLLREINKAFVGFQAPQVPLDVPISTGRWGCGAFQGDSQLKLVIQWIACSLVGREMYFFPYMDCLLLNIEEIIEKIKDFNIGELFKIVQQFCLQIGKNEKIKLFDYILNQLQK